MTIKKTNLTKLLLTTVLALSLVSTSFVSASTSCPSGTTPSETSAILVGEVTDHGGDPNLTVWFQYGKTQSYGFESAKHYKNGTGDFCITVFNLEPCTTYHYRAVAQNSAGTSYGQNYSFATKCLPVSVDLKANSSDGPISVGYGSSVNLSWTSQNAVSCTASGDWSGSKTVSGSQSITVNQIKTYTFTLTCQDSTGTKTSSDSVTVNVTAKPPTVITKPAVVTY